MWLPAHGDSRLPDATVQNKASLSARAAAGLAVFSGTGQADSHSQQPAGASAAPRLPFGSPLGPESQRPTIAASSSSSARVLSEAFSNLLPETSAQRRLQTAAAVSTGHRSGAGENQTAAFPVDVTSSVSGLVTPCRAHQGLPQGGGLTKHDETPGSHLEESSDPAWGRTKLSDDADFDVEPRLSQSHPDSVVHHSGDAQVCSDLPPAVEDQQAWSQEAEPPAVGFQHAATCHTSPSHLSIPASLCCSEPPGQSASHLSEALTEQPSGYLSREASVWSVEPPGALSAEPSGCWDDLPDAPLSPEVTGHNQAADSQQLLGQLHEPFPKACVDVLRTQHSTADAYPGAFEMPEDFTFELPSLDSPDQAPLPDLCPDQSQPTGTTAAVPQGGCSNKLAPQSQAAVQHLAMPQPECGSESAVQTRADVGCGEVVAVEPAPGANAYGPGSLSALLASEEVSSRHQGLRSEAPSAVIVHELLC